MTTEENIKNLKDLRIAYECALNYDYVPDFEEAGNLIDDMFPTHLKISFYDLVNLLKKYEGNSTGNIANLIIDAIDEL